MKAPPNNFGLNKSFFRFHILPRNPATRGLLECRAGATGPGDRSRPAPGLEGFKQPQPGIFQSPCEGAWRGARGRARSPGPSRAASPQKSISSHPLAALLLLAFFLIATVGDCAAAPKNKTLESSPPSVGYDVKAEVFRGEACKLIPRAIVMPRNTVKFVVVKQPRNGSLEGPWPVDRERVAYLYRNDGRKGVDSDRVEFKFKTADENAWGRLTAQIAIKDPPGRLVVEDGPLDFEMVPVGQKRSLPVKIRNEGGGVVRGVIQVRAPWSLVEPPEFELGEGMQRRFEVVFSPTEPGDVAGKIVFQSGSGASPEIKTLGRGGYRFEVLERVAYDKTHGFDFLQILNTCSEDVTLSVAAPPPLLCQSEITVPAGGSGKLNLALREGVYTGKKVELEIGDGAATRKVQVDLPPSPVVLEWDGGPEMDVGPIPFRNNWPMRIGLRNAGATGALVSLDVGEGVELAPSQESQFLLEAEKKVFVDVVWKLPEEPGEVRSRIEAVNSGLKSVLLLKAAVEPPESLENPPGLPAPAPIAETKPTETKPEVADGDLKFEQISDSKKKRLKEEPSKVECDTRRGWLWDDLILSWNYSGPAPVEFVVEIYGLPHAGGFFKNPLEKRLEIPGESPVKPSGGRWIPLASEIKQSGARWEAVIPAMPPPGYHKFRLGSRPRGESQFQFCEFPLVIPDPPPLWRRPGFLLSILFFSFASLFFQKIRRMLNPSQPPD